MALSLLLCPLLCRLQLSNSNTNGPVSAVVVSLAVQATSNTNGPVSAVVVSLAVQATNVKHHWSPLIVQKFAMAAVI